MRKRTRNLFTTQTLILILKKVNMKCADEYSSFSEVGKAQVQAPSATSATFAIAEVALRINFLF